ncbi:hypothetical protein [Paenibacillus illinoisensis]|uniref:hypothetical protein n=1 Tax=Paenibacillus illinoisensis TaxID=59845 RepID=UPI0028A1EE9A|nr:hypothetical protein [Paenibacillus illinoisensis]
MELRYGNVAILLPPVYITIIGIIIIFLLVRWGKQLETRRFTVFFYFWISTSIAPIYSHGTTEVVFQLSLPIGFLLILLYLSSSKRYHPFKNESKSSGAFRSAVPANSSIRQLDADIL